MYHSICVLENSKETKQIIRNSFKYTLTFESEIEYKYVIEKLWGQVIRSF